MASQKVPAGNGLQWLTEAIQLILKNPAPFLLMGLVIGVISAVPLLGMLALVILGPALYGGIMYAAREQESGANADFQQLFQAFREPGKLGKMIMLCLPGVVAGVIIVVLMVMLVGGALLGAGVSGNSSSSMLGAGLGIGGLLIALICMAVALAAYALTFFATPQVMLTGAEPIQAMKDSLQACLANILAVLVYCAIVFVVGLVLALILSWIPFIGMLVLTTVMTPVVAVAAYIAWRQIYRNDITQEIPPASPPPM